MKLYYYKDDVGNFGDDLNPWLWDQLIPNVLDSDEESLFVGIGTLINHKLPINPQKIIFGSGVGYGSLPVVDRSWTIYCVRGPLSAKALKIDKKLAISDSAILVRSLKPILPKKIYSYSFMPHFTSAQNADWEEICKMANVNFIDPSAPMGVEYVLEEIGKSDVVIAEAMHGAILADALRVPWIPVKCYSYINDFKWKDWIGSIDMKYQPHLLPSLWDVERNSSSTVVVKNHVKRFLSRCKIWKSNWCSPPPPKSSIYLREQATIELSLLCNDNLAQLSNDKKIFELTDMLLEKIDNFKRDFANGRFCKGDRS